MYIALILRPGFTREEALSLIDQHFATQSGPNTANRTTIVTHPAQPQPPASAQIFTSASLDDDGNGSGVHGASAPHASIHAAPPAASQPAAEPAPQLDKEGLPWDDRIHSTPAKLTEAGVYRKRKGLDESTKTRVAAELRAKLASGSAAANGAAPPAPGGASGIPIPADVLARINAGESVTLTPAQIEWLNAQGGKAAVGPPPPPSAGAGLPPPPSAGGLPPPPPRGPSPDELAYTAFITSVSNHIAAKKFDENWVAQVVEHFGGAGATVVTIKATPHIVKAVHDYINTTIQ